MIPRRIPRSALCALVTIAAGLSQAGVANAGLTVDKTRVQVGDDYVVTASTDVDVSIWGNRYEIGIYNDQGNLVHSCGPRQSTCVMGVTAKWNNPDNYRPKSPIKYSATLVDTWQGQNVDLGTVAVSVLPHRFHVDLAFASGGGGLWNATATTESKIRVAGYGMKIESLAGYISNCGTTETCGPVTVGENNAYRAVVLGGGRIQGSSDWYVIAPGEAPKDIGASDVDLAAIAAMFTSVSGFCDAIMAAGTHLLGGSVSDQFLGCEAGQSVIGSMVGLLAAGTLGVVVYAATAGTETGPDPGPSPTPTPTPTPPSDGGGTTTPAPLPPGIVLPDDLEARLKDQNWDYLKQRLGDEDTITEVVSDVAQQCEARAVNDGMSTSECARLPVFAVGRLYPQARDHIIRGLAYGVTHGAPWFRLTYKDVVRTSWYYGYPETDGGALSCRGTGFETACDEYPWQATEQGGEPSAGSGTLVPHLKIIDFSQNSASGGDYGGFVDACKMKSRKGDPVYGDGDFLVAPMTSIIPDLIPSLYLCNGPNPPA